MRYSSLIELLRMHYFVVKGVLNHPWGLNSRIFVVIKARLRLCLGERMTKRNRS